MIDFNYHLQLLGESVEHFMTLVNLQLLVKGFANTRYEARRATQMQFPSPQTFCYPKLLSRNL